MKSRSMTNGWIILFIILFGMIWISSCSTLPFQSPEEALRKRVEGMMNAKINNDWGEVYGYLDPVYRKKTSKKAFLNFNREVTYSKYSIESIEIQPSGKEATVKIKQDMKALMFDFENQPETQHWVKDGFTWYLKLK